MKVYLVRQEWELRLNDKISTDYTDVKKTYIGDSKEDIDSFLNLIDDKENLYERLESGEKVQVGTGGMVDFIENDNIAVFARYVLEVVK